MTVQVSIPRSSGLPPSRGIQNLSGGRDPGWWSPDLPIDEPVAGYLRRKWATNTWRSYRSAWTVFNTWCDLQGVSALPASPGTVARFLADQAERGFRPSTIAHRLAAISAVHRQYRLNDPTRHQVVRDTIAGIRRAVGTAPIKKEPITDEVVKTLIEALDPYTLRGRRDRALILLGFAAALRRSELVALEVGDLDFVDGGMLVTIRRSKTDPFGEGQVVAVPRGDQFDVPGAVRIWLDSAGIHDGAVFRRVDRHGNVGKTALTGRSVAMIVKRTAEVAGLDPAQFSGHSLRAGFATTVARHGAGLTEIRRVTRHRSEKVLLGYILDSDPFRDHPAAGFL